MRTCRRLLFPLLAALVAFGASAGPVHAAAGRGVRVAGAEAGPRLPAPQVRDELARWQDPAAAAADSLLAICRDPGDPGRLAAYERVVVLGEEAPPGGARAARSCPAGAPRPAMALARADAGQRARPRYRRLLTAAPDPALSPMPLVL